MRLPRPYIPLRVRVQVAERQFFDVAQSSQELGFARSIYVEDIRGRKPLSYCLTYMLGAMFGHRKVELHHRPALLNRIRKTLANGTVTTDYIPDANDPEYLVYVTKEDHGIETRVRGLHGQHSDLALARKRKRAAKKRALSKGVLQARSKSLFSMPRMRSKLDPPEATKAWFKKAKWKWPKRKFPKRMKRRT